MRSATMRLPGHPDAACDLVAEAIVDEYVRRDPSARLHVNVQGGHGALFVTGEVLSQVEPDVSAVAKRALANAGIMSDIEPFVSLEPVASEQVAHVQAGGAMPVIVMGYATSETPEMVPAALVHARRIAQAIEDHRINNEAWFWAGADGEVSVILPRDKAPIVHVRLEQGNSPLNEARQQVIALVRTMLPGADVYMNASGAQVARGLMHVAGASGRGILSYGGGLPATPSYIGSDMHDANRAGTWLARAAAREALHASGVKAVLLRATYMPGDVMPSHLSARDERGKDLSSHVRREDMALHRVAETWWRPNVIVDAARWGFAGVADMPWET